MTAGLLPRIRTWRGYRRVFPKAGTWRPGVRAVCARHGLPARRLSTTPPGTCVVFRAGPKRLVKLFPPMVARDAAVEAAALEAARRAGIPVPRLVARGVLEDRVAWPYLILEPVPGRPFREVLARMPRRDRVAVMASVGRMLRALHRLRIPLPRPAWPRRIRLLTGAALAAYRRAGSFSPALRRDLARRLPRLTRPTGSPRLLHADLNEDHVLVACRRGRWIVTGLIDFADAEAGDPMYEWMPLWLGLMGRDPALCRSFLRGYAPGVRVTEAWADRAAAFVLIHAFGPGSVLAALRRDRVDPAALDWAGLRDRVGPARQGLNAAERVPRGGPAAISRHRVCAVRCAPRPRRPRAESG
jgi:Ser/Thr protein kinase RdoA (MazF antagonist)